MLLAEMFLPYFILCTTCIYFKKISVYYSRGNFCLRMCLAILQGSLFFIADIAKLRPTNITYILVHATYRSDSLHKHQHT